MFTYGRKKSDLLHEYAMLEKAQAQFKNNGRSWLEYGNGQGKDKVPVCVSGKKHVVEHKKTVGSRKGILCKAGGQHKPKNKRVRFEMVKAYDSDEDTLDGISVILDDVPDTTHYPDFVKDFLPEPPNAKPSGSQSFQKRRLEFGKSAVEHNKAVGSGKGILRKAGGQQKSKNKRVRFEMVKAYDSDEDTLDGISVILDDVPDNTQYPDFLKDFLPEPPKGKPSGNQSFQKRRLAFGKYHR